MLQKIKNFFIKLFCFFFISLIWAISMASYAEGGAEINGILAFLLWLVNLIILFKVSAVVSAIGSSILIIVLRITKFGFNDVVLYGLGIVAVMFGAIALFLKLMWRDNGGENNIGQQDTVKRKKQQYSKKQKTEYQGWDLGYNNFGYDGKEIESPNSRGAEIKEEKEFYNIKDRNHSADCPHIYHKSSDGGQEPYYCGLRDCQISSDEYYHLCAYEWTAEKKCPYKGRR